MKERKKERKKETKKQTKKEKKKEGACCSLENQVVKSKK